MQGGTNAAGATDGGSGVLAVIGLDNNMALFGTHRNQPPSFVSVLVLKWTKSSTDC